MVTFLLTDVIAVVHREEIQKSLTKPRIVDLFLKLQEHTKNTITLAVAEIKNFNSNPKGPESQVVVAKKYLMHGRNRHLFMKYNTKKMMSIYVKNMQE